MYESKNKPYYENTWEEVTLRPSFALVDDDTMKKAKTGYEFGCLVGEKLAKQKVDDYVLTQKKSNENFIKRNRFLFRGGIALTIASGTITILEPSLLGLTSTLTTLGFTTVIALHAKEKESTIDELELLSDNISNDNIPKYRIKKNRSN